MVDRTGQNLTDHSDQAHAVIVSVFGRGDWLASELAGRGWKVTLIDVSDQMGTWSSEEAEGPFGFLECATCLPSVKTRLMVEGEAVDVPQGLVLWLPEGPLELKSELTPFMLSKFGVGAEVQSYLRAPLKSRERELRRILKKPFDESWLVHFAHQFSSTEFTENHRAAERKTALPLLTSFLIRNPTEAGRAKSLKACQASGVKVRAHARLKDLKQAGREFDAVELADEPAGVESGRVFVWMLSSAETARCPDSIGARVFPQGVKSPQWYWACFHVGLEAGLENEMPRWVAILKDPQLPWVHANLLIVRRGREPGRVSVWMRLPEWARFDKTYLENQAIEACEVMAAKLPGSRPKVMRWPSEYDAASRQEGEIKFGPPRHPVFVEGECGGRPTVGRNFFLDSPETWNSLDWLGISNHQAEILAKLEKIKIQWDAAARKKAARMARELARQAAGEGGHHSSRGENPPS